jgi:hypothetical protein
MTALTLTAERLRELLDYNPDTTANDFDYGTEDIEFETEAADDATDDEYRALMAIFEIAKRVSDEANVELRDHIALVHDKELERRRSVLVTIPWKGHKLSREYQL